MSDKKDLETIGIATLFAIAQDQKAPKTARAQAARTLLEVAGLIGRLQTEKPSTNKGLHELSRDELDREIERLSRLSVTPVLPDTGQDRKNLTFPEGWD